ncbi:tetratricopeptide repeat protein [Calothrix sp. PCC 6303]|uniref:tetratricopeptide repeat protein n=1 Tax=Calothrix sp. PCC 6303 TaxID=1170562 RepID=UPI0002A030A7|nr:tetratricopeptide repeat protein [Calothrix sp. PCC 6303]AFZ01381.1 hypothetical protein Cal6303_2374 [Calothrix sp. PCC 6303]
MPIIPNSEKAPNSHQYWYNRGLALHYLGRYEEAIESYDLTFPVKSLLQAANPHKGRAILTKLLSG